MLQNHIFAAEYLQIIFCLGLYTMLKFNCTLENIILEEEKTMVQGEQDGNQCIQTAQRTLADLNKTMQVISS